jgi:hypothetical protein
MILLSQTPLPSKMLKTSGLNITLTETKSFSGVIMKGAIWEVLPRQARLRQLQLLIRLFGFKNSPAVLI